MENQNQNKPEMMRSWACRYKPVNSDSGRTDKRASGQVWPNYSFRSKPVWETADDPTSKQKIKTGPDRAEGPNPQNQEFEVSSVPSSS